MYSNTAVATTRNILAMRRNILDTTKVSIASSWNLKDATRNCVATLQSTYLNILDTTRNCLAIGWNILDTTRNCLAMYRLKYIGCHKILFSYRFKYIGYHKILSSYV